MKQYTNESQTANLIELGFDVPTDRYYHIYDDVIEAQNSLEMTIDGCADFCNSLNRCRCAAPTQSLLQRWLREEIGLILIIRFDPSEQMYDWGVFLKTQPIEFTASEEYFEKYEFALEDALKYALENLVI